MSYVLVVEDDIDIRAMTVLMLQDKGVKCVGAANGLEALNFICDPSRQKEPYLILLDLNMPVMSGQQFLNVMRRCDNMACIPIVIISGECHLYTPANGPPIEAITKPLTPQRLESLIEKYRPQ